MNTPDQNQDRSEGTLQSAASIKAFLLTRSTKSNLNLYDHLTQMLLKVTDGRPHDAVDVIEDVSREVKRASLAPERSALQDATQPTAAELLAEQQRLLFDQPEEAEQKVETCLPNLNEIRSHFEQAGVGLGGDEMQRILLSLKQLIESRSLQRCRLWGKILGIESSYIVAEAEPQKEKEGEEEEEEEERSAEEEERRAETPQSDSEARPLPQSTYKPKPAVPKEPNGTGANRFVYYVCKEPGLPWTKLPPVTPAHITAARHIRKFLKGRLDAPITSFPPFPGNESNYLRARIARISAGTQVSPEGYYLVGEDESDKEAEAQREIYEVNPDFEGAPASEMAESNSKWVHHVQHILQQGRCIWVNTVSKQDGSANEEEEAEEREEGPDEPEPEVGPSMLTPLSQDEEMFSTPSWTLKMSSSLTSQYAVAMLRSNLWPGAFAYSYGEKFENIYIGWGMKSAGQGFTPSQLPLPQVEYLSGEELTEEMDPSREQELKEEAPLEEKLASEEEVGDSDVEKEESDD